MLLKQHEIQSLTDKAMNAYRCGCKIGIFSAPHDQLAQEFPHEAFRFYDKPPATTFPQNIPVVFSVIRIGHDFTDHIHLHNRDAIVRVMHKRELRGILRVLVAYFNPLKGRPKNGHTKLNGRDHTAVLESVACVAQAPPRQCSAAEVEEAQMEILTQLTTRWLATQIQRSNELKNLKAQIPTGFIRDFMAAAGSSKKPGYVNKTDLATFRDRYGIRQEPRELIGYRLIEKEVLSADSTAKTSWYKPGPYMLEIFEGLQFEPPTEPLALAEWRVARGPDLAAKKEELSLTIETQIKELERTTQAKIDELNAEKDRMTGQLNARLAEQTRDITTELDYLPTLEAAIVAVKSQSTLPPGLQ